MAAVSAFSQTLRRYTSLNHLAQAARAVLQNPQQISQMWNDLNKVDFNNVQEQSSWVCQCDESLISKLEQDFKQTLAQQVGTASYFFMLKLNYFSTRRKLVSTKQAVVIKCDYFTLPFVTLFRTF